MRQIGQGIMQYTQENDERIPPARYWRSAAYQFTRDVAVYKCPSNPNSRVSNIQDSRGVDVVPQVTVAADYGINDNLSDNYGGYLSLGVVNLHRKRSCSPSALAMAVVGRILGDLG
jgi:hypothetical protein